MHAARYFGVQAGAGRTTTQTVEATIFSTDLTQLLSLFLHGALRASWKKWKWQLLEINARFLYVISAE
jgi:hypothetical protein